MRTQIPSTQSLVVFEVVARYLNATHASQELCLTASAVSKQLQSLEDVLGVKLFTRGQHGLLLTQAGQSYLDTIKPAMATLAEASEKVACKPLHQTELHFRVPPAFAERWLLPRISEFIEANPDLKINVDASGMRDENLLATYDAYVRFGNGSWPGCVADYLCGRQLIIVASPDLLRRTPPITSPNALLRFSLFQPSWNPMGWISAFEALGVTCREPPAIVQWDFFSVIIRSACVGLGLALVAKCFVTEEIRKGELVQVLDYCQPISHGNYFVFSEARREDASIARLRNWLRTKRSGDE